MANAPNNQGYETQKVWEVRTTYRFPKYKLRVWSKSDTYRFGPDQGIINCCKVIEKKGYGGDPSQIIAEIVRLGYISACEVVDPEENGICYYPEWP